MQEVVLVAPALYHLDAFQLRQLREDEFQQTAFVKQFEADGGSGRKDDFVQFLGDALHGDDFDAVGVAFDGLERLGLDVELQL